MTKTGKIRRAALACLVTLFVFIFIEAGIRLIGFRYERSLSYMRFNFPNPDELHQVFEPDEFLLWRMRPGFDFGEGFEPLNSRGYRGPEFVLKKDPGTLRIACLGDSVTFGRPGTAYPDLLEKRLEQLYDWPVETMNFGVPGYSSWQGLKLMPRVIDLYQPDVVVIMFGWNDHWLARGYADQDQIVAETRAPALLDLVRSLRIYQALNRLVAAIKGAEADAPLVLRARPDHYRVNLGAMIDMCHRKRIDAILATAPSAISAGPVPDFFTHLEFIREPDDLARLHAEYNDVTRKTAEEHHAMLVDLDLIFIDHDVTSLFEDPEKDLIHPNEKGYELIADTMAEAVAELFQGLEQ